MDLTPIEPDGEWKVEDRRINTSEHEDAILATLRFCGDTAVNQIDRRYQRFRADIGLADDSNSDALVEFSLLLDNRIRPTATVTIGPATVEHVDVDISGAFRMTIAAVNTAPSVCGTADRATAAWFNTSLT